MAAAVRARRRDVSHRVRRQLHRASRHSSPAPTISSCPARPRSISRAPRPTIATRRRERRARTIGNARPASASVAGRRSLLRSVQHDRGGARPSRRFVEELRDRLSTPASGSRSKRSSTCATVRTGRRTSSRRKRRCSPTRRRSAGDGELGDADGPDSDHPAYHSDQGPSWVASVVNAIGESSYWTSTAIIVIWDDWGGFYDNASPPQLDYRGLGIRVPCLIISPYAKTELRRPHAVRVRQHLAVHRGGQRDSRRQHRPDREGLHRRTRRRASTTRSTSLRRRASSRRSERSIRSNTSCTSRRRTAQSTRVDAGDRKNEIGPPSRRSYLFGLDPLGLR